MKRTLLALAVLALTMPSGIAVKAKAEHAHPQAYAQNFFCPTCIPLPCSPNCAQ